MGMIELKIPHENIPFYLYVHHMCFKGMKFVCKKHELMK